MNYDDYIRKFDRREDAEAYAGELRRTPNRYRPTSDVFYVESHACDKFVVMQGTAADAPS